MFPMAWGHEFAGTIVDMGSDVKEFEVGEMVGIGYDNCGECEFCKKGLTSECVTLGLEETSCLQMDITEDLVALNT